MATINRKNLYDLVWSTPMSKACASFGISDVGLKKVCQRYGIPFPPRGHWAKIAANRNTTQTKFTGDPVIQIHIRGGKDPNLSDNILGARNELLEKGSPTIDKNLTTLHPKLLALQKKKPFLFT